ncbi:hypothetical protein OG373_08890 [Streptomyces avidinii]|uniref:hypothetical protein n=1 Tax=Streptomyces avidinii TaxID=1895 RepID=UPI003866C7E9|nr:hypothetical protein OG373_08890 [Streptomyces avidinii]
MNASARVGFAVLGALLAGGLLLAACAAPEDRPRAGEVVFRHRGVVVGREGRAAHARKAVQIMDAWPAVMEQRREDDAGLRAAHVDGIAQETCRNLMRVGHALAASAYIAETAWHQGVDPYGEQSARLRTWSSTRSTGPGPRPRRGCAGAGWSGPWGPARRWTCTATRRGPARSSRTPGHRSRRPGRPGRDGLFVARETVGPAEAPPA